MSQTPSTPEPRPLSQRVFLLQQIVPLILSAVTICYEITQHLIFPNLGHTTMLGFEILAFGITGPVVLWITLSWIGREIRAREVAESAAETNSRMLQEMHHRIKNNLQVVADLLSLETLAPHASAGVTRSNGRLSNESLRDSVARIKSIAVAHEMLSLDQIGNAEITELARRIAESTRSTLARPEQTIDVHVDGAPIFLNSKSATAFALVINELVTNAMEHGLASRTVGNIELELKQEDSQITVSVKDDGVGLTDGFELSRAAGLGLNIVRTLVERDLHGSLRLENKAGTRAEFTFRLNGVQL